MPLTQAQQGSQKILNAKVFRIFTFSRKGVIEIKKWEDLRYNKISTNRNLTEELIDEEKLKSTEFRYGKITKKVVIYRGENTTLKNGIEYRNVEEYLKSLV